jgi:hypothetical protein
MKAPARMLWVGLALALCGALLSACGDEGNGWQKPRRDFMAFQSDVMPVLLRDCAFSTCHGAPERFFRVWGPGRTRLNPMTRAFDIMTGDEASLNLQHALSMIDNANPSRSLLLRKPLAMEAGGAGHLGADKFGRNVYRTVNDDGYLKLSRWVLNAPPPAPAPAAQ